MFKKRLLLLVSFVGALHAQAPELEELSVGRIQIQKDKIVRLQKRNKGIITKLLVVAGGAAATYAVVHYKNLHKPVVAVVKKDETSAAESSEITQQGWLEWALDWILWRSKESAPKKSDLEIKNEISERELKTAQLVRENFDLRKKEEHMTIWEFIKEKHAIYIGLGAIAGLGTAAYKILEGETIKYYRFIKELFAINIDNPAFYGKQIISNCDNLELFLDNYIDTDSRSDDRALFKRQILECHRTLIRCIENAIAAFAIKARQSGNDQQVRWLLSRDNRIFHAVIKFNEELSEKLSQSIRNSKFYDISACKESLEGVLRAVDVVAQNCEAQLYETHL